jgi:hypothetical protein
MALSFMAATSLGLNDMTLSCLSPVRLDLSASLTGRGTDFWILEKSFRFPIRQSHFQIAIVVIVLKVVIVAIWAQNCRIGFSYSLPRIESGAGRRVVKDH